MGATVVQHIQLGTTSSQPSLIVSNMTASGAGNLLVLMAAGRAASAPTLSISGGGSWTNRFQTATSGTAFGTLALWDIVPGTSVANNVITISSTVSGSISYELWEISGQAASPYEGSNSVAGSSLAPSESYTTTNANDFVAAGFMLVSATVTVSGLPSSPWVNETSTVTGVGAGGTSHQMQNGYEILSSTGAQTYGGTLSSTLHWITGLAAYNCNSGSVTNLTAGGLVTSGKAWEHGCIEREGTVVSSNSYQASLGGYDVNSPAGGPGICAWINLQANHNGPITTNNVIDQAITDIDNNWPAGSGLNLRVIAGINSPNWALCLGAAQSGNTNVRNQWAAGTTYALDDGVYYTSGGTTDGYVSIQNGNVGNTPGANTTTTTSGSSSGTLHVASNSVFAATGVVAVNILGFNQLVTYTGKGTGTLTGCTGMATVPGAGVTVSQYWAQVSFTMTDVQPHSSTGGEVPRFWTGEFGAAWQEFEAALAVKYDSAPEIRNFIPGRFCTVYGESMLRNQGGSAGPQNIANLIANGYSTGAPQGTHITYKSNWSSAATYSQDDGVIDAQGVAWISLVNSNTNHVPASSPTQWLLSDEVGQIAQLYVSAALWSQTTIAVTCNPYTTVNATTGGAGTSLQFTQQMITTARAVMGTQALLQNNSMRYDYISGNGQYQTMYGYFQAAGGPIGIQTAALGSVGPNGTYPTLAQFQAMLAWLANPATLGASYVELPTGYGTAHSPYTPISAAQMASASAALVTGGGTGGVMQDSLTDGLGNISLVAGTIQLSASDPSISGQSDVANIGINSNPGQQLITVTPQRFLGSLALDDNINSWIDHDTGFDIASARLVTNEPVINRFGLMTWLKDDAKPTTITIKGWYADGGGSYFRDFKAAMMQNNRVPLYLGDGTCFYWCDCTEVTGRLIASNLGVNTMATPDQRWAYVAKIQSYEAFVREVSPQIQSLLWTQSPGAVNPTNNWLTLNNNGNPANTIVYGGTVFGEATFQVNWTMAAGQTVSSITLQHGNSAGGSFCTATFSPALGAGTWTVIFNAAGSYYGNSPDNSAYGALSFIPPGYGVSMAPATGFLGTSVDYTGQPINLLPSGGAGVNDNVPPLTKGNIINLVFNGGGSTTSVWSFLNVTLICPNRFWR